MGNKMAKKRLLESRILDALSREPMTCKRLSEVADAPHSSIRKVLNALCHSARVHAVGTVREWPSRNAYVYGVRG